jgi:hypothetical protein
VVVEEVAPHLPLRIGPPLPGATPDPDQPRALAVVTRVPQTGDLVKIGAAASVQFAGDRALLMRVTSVNKKPTYQGWVWLTGYVLNDAGEATAKREVFVQMAGLRTERPGHLPTPRRAMPDAVGTQPRT